MVKALIEAGADAIKDDPIDEKATPMYLGCNSIDIKNLGWDLFRENFPHILRLEY